MVKAERRRECAGCKRSHREFAAGKGVEGKLGERGVREKYQKIDHGGGPLGRLVFAPPNTELLKADSAVLLNPGSRAEPSNPRTLELLIIGKSILTC